MTKRQNDSSDHDEAAMKKACLDLDNSVSDGTSDDDEIWEEITAVENSTETTPNDAITNIAPICVSENDIVRQLEYKPISSKRRIGITKQQRLFRINLHQVHLLTLLVSSLFANTYSNNIELQCLLLSLVPLPYHVKIANSVEISKRIATLIEWWLNTFQAKKAVFGTACLSLDAEEMWKHIYGKDELLPNIDAISFTAVCRAFNIDARLVASLHPIQLSFSSKKKAGPFAIEYWIEVYDDELQRYVPVDIGNRRFSASTEKGVSYVVSWDASSAVKDVTARYAQISSITSFKNSVLKDELHNWWKVTLWLYSKGYRTTRDVAEEEELQNITQNDLKSMPTSFNGFINHPL